MSNNSVAFWNKTWKKEKDRYYKHFVAIANKLDDKAKVIDIGCGCGTLLRFLRNQRPDLSLQGQDHSDYAIERIKKDYIKATVVKLPKIEGTADVIVATEVFEHIKNDNLLLKNCAKAANKLIMTVPNDRLGPEECDEHERKYTAKTLEEKISKHYKHFEIYIIESYLLAIAWNK